MDKDVIFRYKNGRIIPIKIKLDKTTNEYMNDKIRNKNDDKKINITDRKNQWQKIRNEKNEISEYKLSDNVKISKILNTDFTTTSYDNRLYVNNKYIMSAGSGYTISYLKELGGLYQDAIDYGIKNPFINYNSSTKEIFIRDNDTGKEYKLKK